MNKYHKWLNESFQRVAKDFIDEVSRPQNESDIRCHLYHTLLQTKMRIEGLTLRHIVLSEFPVLASQERVDLALGWWRKKDRIFEPRLLVEIKETSLPHLSAEEVEKRISGDIDKLRKFRKMLEEEQNTQILKHFTTPAVVFFFRGANKQGIAVKTNREMKKLQGKYDDIIILWGPS
jgi:hypothetical protein